ncbi:MAG: hypothetical protein GF350_00630 [Chitinivibrionales bacterium]|nr:hypothetical protein [Chitinivibrionales bacterium]
MLHRFAPAAIILMSIVSLSFCQSIMDVCLSDTGSDIYQFVPDMTTFDTTGMGITRTVSGTCDSVTITLSGEYEGTPFTIPATVVKQPPCTLQATWNFMGAFIDTAYDVCTPVGRAFPPVSSGSSVLSAKNKNGTIMFIYSVNHQNSSKLELTIFNAAGKCVCSFENLSRKKGVIFWDVGKEQHTIHGIYLCVLRSENKKIGAAKFYK